MREVPGPRRANAFYPVRTKQADSGAWARSHCQRSDLDLEPKHMGVYGAVAREPCCRLRESRLLLLSRQK